MVGPGVAIRIYGAFHDKAWLGLVLRLVRLDVEILWLAIKIRLCRHLAFGVE